MASESPGEKTAPLDGERPAREESRAGEAPYLRRGEVLEERYVVEEELGRGGGGRVYRAFDTGTSSKLAVKVLDPDKWTGTLVRDQLYRELRCGRVIQHPNVARFYDVFQGGGRWFLTMELASGGTLRATLQHGADRPLTERVADARAAAAGLAAIHAAGIVHRDFKPENILRMADGRLAVSDFGLARVLEQSMLSTTLAGTPGYLAPEVLAGGKTSQAADVWALGVVLHEIAVGERPDTVGALPRLSPAAATATEPRELVALIEVCKSCLQVRPERRPASGGEVVKALERALGAQPRRRWPRRRWLAAGATLLLAGSLITWRSLRPTPARPPEIAEGADWSGSRVLARTRYAQCVRALEANPRVARLMVMGPQGRLEAMDLDVSTGRLTPVPLVAAARSHNCPAWSPDGRSLLYTTADRNDRSQIWYSPHPDGRDAVALVDGQRPAWFPAGARFAFVTEDKRIAMTDLAGVRHVFSRVGPPPSQVEGLVIDEQGKRLGAFALVRPIGGERVAQLEIYDAETTRQIESRPAPYEAHDLVYDPFRRTFQHARSWHGRRQWIEHTGAGAMRTLGRLDEADIFRAARVAGGFVVLAVSAARPLALVGEDGLRVDIGRGHGSPAVSRGGDVVFNILGQPSAGASKVTYGEALRQVAYWRLADRKLRVISGGPMDDRPDISLDGKRIGYYRASPGEIVLCDVKDGGDVACAAAHMDPSVSSYQGLRFSPAGTQLAYFARDDYQEEHISLRILTIADRRVRDLGRIASRCGLRWGSEQTLWILPDEGPWREVDSATGKPTSRTFQAQAGAPADCTHPPPAGSSSRYRVDMESAMEIRLVEEAR